MNWTDRRDASEAVTTVSNLKHAKLSRQVMAEVCLRPLRNNPPIQRWGELPGAYTPDTENTKGTKLKQKRSQYIARTAKKFLRALLGESLGFSLGQPVYFVCSFYLWRNNWPDISLTFTPLLLPQECCVTWGKARKTWRASAFLLINYTENWSRSVLHRYRDLVSGGSTDAPSESFTINSAIPTIHRSWTAPEAFKRQVRSNFVVEKNAHVNVLQIPELGDTRLEGR